MSSDEVLASKRYLSAIGQWPQIPSEANPEGWLRNFDEDESAHAVAVLEALLYFSDELTTKLFSSTIHSLSSEVGSSENTYAARRQVWNTFLDNCIITFPTGETPGPTDSGYVFARKARQVLSFEERQVVAPENLISRLWERREGTVLFVDDFAGSGDQFMKTWRRSYRAPDQSTTSIQDEVEKSGWTAYYLPAVATEKAFNRLANDAPNVVLGTAHLLGTSYTAVDAATVVFPENLREGARAFVQNASSHARISNDKALGYDKLALVLAFEHSVPDASLPLIWHETSDWTPLMRRS